MTKFLTILCALGFLAGTAVYASESVAADTPTKSKKAGKKGHKGGKKGKKSSGGGTTQAPK